MNEMMLRQAGLFVGLFLRLVLPAVYVWYNSDDFEWDHKYTKQFILSLVLAFVGVVMGYTDPEPNLTPYQMFWFSVKDGVVLEEVVNQVRKWDVVRVDKMLRERLNDG